MKQFRPVQYSGKWKVRAFLTKVHTFDMKFRDRGYLERLPIMERIFYKLHYLGSHSPDPIQVKWHKVETKFLNDHRSLDL